RSTVSIRELRGKFDAKNVGVVNVIWHDRYGHDGALCAIPSRERGDRCGYHWWPCDWHPTWRWSCATSGACPCVHCSTAAASTYLLLGTERADLGRLPGHLGASPSAGM